MKNNNIFSIKSILVALAILSTITSFAQRSAPGYMGKRFVLLYDQGFSWSFGETIRGVPNFFYTLSGDYAVSKKHSIGAEYSFRTRYYGSKYTDRYSVANDYQLERTMVHKIGFYTKLFSQRNGHIAPAGPYFIAGVHFHIIQSKFKIQPYGFNSYTIPDKGVTCDFAPFFGGGKQYIVGNKFVLDVSMRLSLPLISVFRSFAYNITGLDGSYNNITEEQIARRSRAVRAGIPNFEANIIELRIGFGGVL